MYRIIQNRKIWLTLSGTVVVLAILAIALWGLNLGIDFTGGSLLEVEFKEGRPDTSAVTEAVGDLGLGSLVVQPVAEKGMILKFQDISEDKHQDVIKALNDLVGKNDTLELNTSVATSSDATTTPVFEIDIDDLSKSSVVQLRFDSVGPSIGQELKSRSITAMIIVLIAIVSYIAWAFRRVSKPVASWKYGLSATIALFHDVIIVIGVFAVLGKFFGVEVNTAFVAAILTVLGYSVKDTIVVFDRVRENLPKSEDNFEETVNTSVNQTIQRSINTSVTTLLVLLAILFFGGVTIKSFVLALAIGVFIGTYSSIFLASPVLVVWEKIMKR
ncbi:protein translocase subunit SecF [Candidatus Parcubacteria bacterium]|nr:protein translocase subunit SecF [Candidatus Parcubacteria bacterium]